MTAHTSKVRVCIILSIAVSGPLLVLDEVPRVALCEPPSDRRGQAVTAMMGGGVSPASYYGTPRPWQYSPSHHGPQLWSVTHCLDTVYPWAS